MGIPGFAPEIGKSTTLKRLMFAEMRDRTERYYIWQGFTVRQAREKARKAIATARKQARGHAAHHLIPSKVVREFPFLKEIGLHTNAPWNGILLPSKKYSRLFSVSNLIRRTRRGGDALHVGNHPGYSEAIRIMMVRVESRFENAVLEVGQDVAAERARKDILRITSRIREILNDRRSGLFVEISRRAKNRKGELDERVVTERILAALGGLVD